MNEPLTLSRTKLTTFLTCQRRFQLRYVRRLAWPERPVSEGVEAALTRGQQFHQLVQQHFLGLPVDTAALQDNQLRRWWRLFEQHPPPLPDGRFLTELTLTVPIGRHVLHGRFDLLITGERETGEAFAQLFDWKTGQAQDEATLRHDWQTRLYLALLAEGGQALAAGEDGRSDGGRSDGGRSVDGHSITPENIALTYWYVSAPEEPVTIQYSQAQHQQNWTDIQKIVAQIDAQLRTGTWPLTDELSHCRTCPYQAYCGRQEAGTDVPSFHHDNAELEDQAVFDLEPELP